MSTLEELKTEAAELYPSGPMDQFMTDASGNRMPTINGWRQEAHVKAKTITAEQVDQAAYVFWDQMIGVARSAVQEVMVDAYRAAGFYVEEPSDV